MVGKGAIEQGTRQNKSRNGVRRLGEFFFAGLMTNMNSIPKNADKEYRVEKIKNKSSLMSLRERICHFCIPAFSFVQFRIGLGDKWSPKRLFGNGVANPYGAPRVLPTGGPPKNSFLQWLFPCSKD